VRATPSVVKTGSPTHPRPILTPPHAHYRWNCPSKNKDYYTGCPYTSYVPYYEYYGTFDYGNRLAIAAVNSENTDFTNGNQDFRGVDAIGRSEFFKKTTAYINAWM
jgi:hypothetical protein